MSPELLNKQSSTKSTQCMQGRRKQIPSGKAKKKSWLLAAGEGEGGAAKFLGLGEI